MEDEKKREQENDNNINHETFLQKNIFIVLYQDGWTNYKFYK